MEYHGVFKENKDSFTEFSINFSDLVSHYARKGATIFCTSSVIVAPPISYN